MGTSTYSNGTFDVTITCVFSLPHLYMLCVYADFCLLPCMIVAACVSQACRLINPKQCGENLVHAAIAMHLQTLELDLPRLSCNKQGLLVTCLVLGHVVGGVKLGSDDLSGDGIRNAKECGMLVILAAILVWRLMLHKRH